MEALRLKVTQRGVFTFHPDATRRTLKEMARVRLNPDFVDALSRKTPLRFPKQCSICDRRLVVPKANPQRFVCQECTATTSRCECLVLCRLCVMARVHDRVHTLVAIGGSDRCKGRVEFSEDEEEKPAVKAPTAVKKAKTAAKTTSPAPAHHPAKQSPPLAVPIMRTPRSPSDKELHNAKGEFLYFYNETTNKSYF
jgi:hypothetical protein